MKHKKRINKNTVYVVAFLLIVAMSVGYKLILSGQSTMIIKHDDASESLQSEPAADGTAAGENAGGGGAEGAVTEPESEATAGTVSIYICGAVNSPGVYEMDSGGILNDVIEMAGGFREDAADEYIDLVYVVRGNMSVYIPTVAEIEAEGYDSWGNSEIYFRSGEEETQAGEPGQAEVDSNSGLVNINTATREQLMTLPGIGEATADAIISYRETTPFQRIEDIMNVSGIGESKYNRIKDLICV